MVRLFAQSLFVRSDPVPFPHLPLCKYNLFQQHPGGHAEGAGAEDNDLFDRVRCGDCDPVFFGQHMGGLLNVEVGRLGLLCEDDVNIVPAQDLAGTACHFVGVKDQDHFFRPVACKVGQDVHQLVTGGLYVAQGELPEIIPCEDDIVSVDKQVMVLWDRLPFSFCVLRPDRMQSQRGHLRRPLRF